MRKLLMLCFIGLNLFGLSMANAGERSLVSYDITYKINYMTCVTDLNDLTLFDSVAVVGKKGKPVLFNYSVDITQYIDEGDNQFKVLVDNAHQFLTPEQVDQAYCDMSVKASALNPETNQLETKEVLHFRASLKRIEEDGQSKVIITTEKSDSPLMSDIVRLVEHDNVDVYKDGSVIVERPWFQTNLQVNHPVTEFSWVNATPVEANDPEIRQKALAKYREIIKAIERKDRQQLKELLEPALSEHAALRGTDRDSYFDLLEEQLFNNLYNLLGWVRKDFSEETFTFETYGHGKLFAYYFNTDYRLSPISWNYPPRRVKWFSPKLMYINGEVKVGAF